MDGTLLNPILCEQVKVVLQVFDMLYLNGKSLLSMSLRVRRQLLRASFTERLGTLHFARGVDHVEDGNTEPIEVHHQLLNIDYFIMKGVVS